jgi:DinB family protein
MEHLLTSARSVLETTAPRWTRLIETLPAELLARPPAAGEWSAVDCLRHLRDTERFAFPLRVRAFLAGQDFPGFDPDQDGTPATDEAPAGLLADFAALRAESLDLLAQLTERDLERTARHSQLGEVTLGQMIHEWAGHDLMHTVQAERALMQPFIVGSGPWRFYFADHDVAGDSAPSESGG